MKSFEIPATEYTPHVFFETATSTLWFRGESYPENASAYYDPIEAWTIAAIAERAPLKLAFALDYLNTSSTKAILDLIEILENYHLNGGQTEIIWLYRPTLEVMKETGEELLEDFSLPHLLKPLD